MIIIMIIELLRVDHIWSWWWSHVVWYLLSSSSSFLPTKRFWITTLMMIKDTKDGVKRGSRSRLSLISVTGSAGSLKSLEMNAFKRILYKERGTRVSPDPENHHQDDLQSVKNSRLTESWAILFLLFQLTLLLLIHNWMWAIRTNFCWLKRT